MKTDCPLSIWFDVSTMHLIANRVFATVVA